ncbi:uncharacterized protein LOC127850733 isoform X2 [Dreissena polymorpha]|uniref:uncharacterized protein LOC127850733 isoform X2 n=1 Tax=Dreissena polymorpha TaxID=45954 RepID=UPI002264B4A3|nr:uncharacterized protein LOC127850733 isoform X2 [Dreissena polymorpha]XP_052239978.1 uncharacterized protein LOC127850733 isoform X2 [Dreissena polymorpha]
MDQTQDHNKILPVVDMTTVVTEKLPDLRYETGTKENISEQFTALSVRMSNALEAIGAEKCTVMKRRKTFMRREFMETITENLVGNILECFHFGSQSEGTTTPGLQSDIDLLFTNKNVNVMTQLRDWENGKQNLLMLYDDITPPQQYLLQIFKPDAPEPETRLWNSQFVRKGPDQILVSSDKFKQTIEENNKDKDTEVSKSGPSVSFLENWDIVEAYTVRKALPEIQHWIDRCRGRHWPSPQLLEAARIAPCFLVPAGHPDSDHKHEEWRLSPNLIERMLMFSFNVTQIKCFIVLKIMKKSLLNKIVKDSFTSFHCKTLMFYTIERTHPDLWKERNLVYLIVLCLKILRKWLRDGMFPHYIIPRVNLFDAKLSFVQQKRLFRFVDSMIKNDLQDLFLIDIDNFGFLLGENGLSGGVQNRESGGVPNRENSVLLLRNSIELFLKFERLERLLIEQRGIVYKYQHPVVNLEREITRCLCKMFGFFDYQRLQVVALEFAKNLCALRASLKSSKQIGFGYGKFRDILNGFRYSLTTDVASTRLKLASALYCRGHLHSAVKILEDIENRYHNKIKAVCGCRDIEGDRDLQLFAKMVLRFDNFCPEPPFAFCVRFARQEAYCVPYILFFEMNRGLTAEDLGQRTYTETRWMDCAEVDARPFLYYIQYLTYGGLGNRDRQIDAMLKLETYICDSCNHINLYHEETAVNLLGHCFEMEGDFRGALHYFLQSSKNIPKNNAANMHVRRILGIING